MSDKKIKDKCKNWCADCKAFDWSYCTEKYEVEKPMENKLTKKEIDVCYLTWGGIPMTKGWVKPDVEWIRNSQLFKNKMKEYYGE